MYIFRYTAREIITYLRPLTDTILDTELCSPSVLISWFFDTYSESDVPLMLWAALAESICDPEVDVPVQSIYSTLCWPLDSKKVKLNGNYVSIKF